jgi:hypothetical protein
MLELVSYAATICGGGAQVCSSHVRQKKTKQEPRAAEKGFVSVALFLPLSKFF